METEEYYGTPNSKVEILSINPNEFFWKFDFDGKENIVFEENKALAYLLAEEIVFLNCMSYIQNDWRALSEKKKKKLKIAGRTIVIYVLCNDIFAWGCSDAEDISSSELQDLWNMYAVDPTWGSAKWCCKKRNEQPQRPVKDDMKKAGSWESWMDDLQPNFYDEHLKKEMEIRINDFLKAKKVRLTKKWNRTNFKTGIEKLRAASEKLLLRIKISSREEPVVGYLNSWHKPNITDTTIKIWEQFRDENQVVNSVDHLIQFDEIIQIDNITNKEFYQNIKSIEFAPGWDNNEKY